MLLANQNVRYTTTIFFYFWSYLKSYICVLQVFDFSDNLFVLFRNKSSYVMWCIVTLIYNYLAYLIFRSCHSMHQIMYMYYTSKKSNSYRSCVEYYQFLQCFTTLWKSKGWLRSDVIDFHFTLKQMIEKFPLLWTTSQLNFKIWFWAFRGKNDDSLVSLFTIFFSLYSFSNLDRPRQLNKLEKQWKLCYQTSFLKKYFSFSNIYAMPSVRFLRTQYVGE